MTIGFRSAGTPTAASAAVSPLSPGVPAGLGNTDLSVLVVQLKQATAGTIPTVSTPAGWTVLQALTNNGNTTSGKDTGSNYVATFYRVGRGYSAPSVTTTGATSAGAVIVAFWTSLGAWDVSVRTSGSDTASGANMSITGGAWSSAIAAGDIVLAGMGASGDVGTVSAVAIGGSSGATLGATTTHANQAITTGTDSRLVVASAAVTAGSSTAAATFTYTNTSSTTGHAQLIRLREVAASDTLPKASTIADSFNQVANEPDGTIWETTGTVGAAIVNGNRLEITPTDTSYPGVTSYNTERVSFHDTSVTFEMPEWPDQQAAGAQVQTFAYVHTDDDSRWQLSYTINAPPGGPYWLMRHQIASGSFDDTSLTPDATAHRWWRLREASGQLYMESAPAHGGPWTIRKQTQRTVSFASVRLRLSSSFNAVPTTTVGTLTAYDNVNVAPVSEQNASAALVSSATLDAEPVVQEHAATALLAAAATLVSTATLVREAAVAMSAGAQLTIAAVREQLVAAAQLVSREQTTVSAERAAAPSVALQTSSALTVTALRETPASVALSASEQTSVTATQTSTQQASAALVASSALSTSATREQPSAASLAASESTGVTATRVQLGAAALTASSALSVSPTLDRLVSVALSASHVLSAEPTSAGQQSASVALVSSESTSVTAVRDRAAAAALSASESTSVTAVREHAPTTLSAAAATLVSSAVRVVPSSVALDSSSTLSTTALAVRAAAVSLAALHQLSVVAIIGDAAEPPLSVGGTRSDVRVRTTRSRRGTHSTRGAAAGSLATIGMTALNGATRGG